MGGLAFDSGRKYTIVTYADIPNPQFDRNDPETWIHQSTIKKRIETPRLIPNGMWVAEAFFGGCKAYTTIVPDGTTVGTITLENNHGRSILLVGSGPFGVIEELTFDGFPVGGKHFISARQISNGELGQYVPVPKLKFAREAFAEGVVKGSERDRRRSHFGWVCLADVVEVSGLSLDEVLLGFWPFVDFQYDRYVCQRPAEIGALTELTFDEIDRKQRQTPRRFERTLLETLLNEGGISAKTWWIRKGLAITILRLLALGMRPTMDDVDLCRPEEISSGCFY